LATLYNDALNSVSGSWWIASHANEFLRFNCTTFLQFDDANSRTLRRTIDTQGNRRMSGLHCGHSKKAEEETGKDNFSWQTRSNFRVIVFVTLVSEHRHCDSVRPAQHIDRPQFRFASSTLVKQPAIRAGDEYFSDTSGHTPAAALHACSS
jgi:hypothetical protein